MIAIKWLQSIEKNFVYGCGCHLRMIAISQKLTSIFYCRYRLLVIPGNACQIYIATNILFKYSSEYCGHIISIDEEKNYDTNLA